jgi:hypothetical protein
MASSFIDQSRLDKKYPHHTTAVNTAQKYTSITGFVIQYSLQSKVFDMVIKEPNMLIPDEFYKLVLPKL